MRNRVFLLVPQKNELSVSHRYRIIIVDDHPLFRRGLESVFEKEGDLSLAGEAGDPSTALCVIEKIRPDLVLVDLALGESSGIELIKVIKKRFPEMHVLVISGFDEPAHVRRSLQSGASGYVLKHEPMETMIIAIRKVLQGDVFVSASLQTELLSQLATGRKASSTDLGAELSDRELEIVDLYGRGMNTADIAERLGLSAKTIDAHRGNIKRKLHAHTWEEFMQFCVRRVMRQQQLPPLA